MIKRLLLLLCLIATAGSAAWAGVLKQGTFKNGGTWKITDDGELYVDAKVIPDFGYGLASGWGIVGMYKLHNYWATVINGNPAGSYYRFTYAFPTSCPWHDYSGRIKSIRLSANVETIGEAAFADLNHLETITFEPRNAANITIKQWAFNTCKEVKTLDLTYVKEIEDNAFANCFALTTVKLGDGLQRAGKVFAESEMLFKEGSYIYLPNNYALSTTYWSLVPDRMSTLDPETHMVSHNMRFSNPHLLSLWKAYLPPTEIYQPDQGIKYVAPMTAYGKYTPQSNTDYTLYYGEPGYWLYCPAIRSLTIDKVVDYATPEERPWHSIAKEIEQAYIHSTKIGSNTFNGCTSLHFVNSGGIEGQFPEITEIGDRAFYGCTNLNMVNLPDIESIGTSAFEQSALQSLKLRCNRVVGFNAIGNRAFAGTPLQYVSVYGNPPATTADNAFSNLTSQKCILYVPISYSRYYEQAPWSDMIMNKIVDFPVHLGYNDWEWELTADGTLTMKSRFNKRLQFGDDDNRNPFYPYREYIKRVVIEGFAYLGPNTLSGLENLTTVEALDLKEVGEGAFKNCSSLASIDLPMVESIGDEAFRGCVALRSIKFGNVLKSIGNKAFYGCTNAASLGLEAYLPPDVSPETFIGMGSSDPQGSRRNASGTGQKSVSLDVPQEAVTNYAAAPYWNLFTMDYIGEHGTILKSGKYYDGAWVIYSDGTLIASSNTSEGDIDGFYYDTTVKRVEFLGNATELNWTGFGANDLPNVEEIILSPAMTKLGNEAFKGLSKLKSINLEGVESIGSETFKGCSSLTKADMGNVKEIGDRAFEGCTSLTDVTLYGKGGKIGYYTFKDCTSLKSIDLSGINYAASGVFEGCTALESVIFRGQALQVYSNMFKNCTALKSLDVSDDCWSINASSLAGTGISRIYSASPKPPTINETAFGDRPLTSITAYVPADYMNAYRKAPMWRDMNFAIDERYGEPQLPTGGLVGEKGTWELDELGALTIDCEGKMPASDQYLGADAANNRSWYSTFDRWAAFIEDVRYTDGVTYIPQNVTDGEAEEGTYHSVKTVEIGCNVDTIMWNAMRYTGLTDVYCFAPEPPFIVTSEENGTFDKAAILARGTTLHVVDFQGTLEKYKNSYRWNWFPKIVADLPTRKPGTIMVEKVNVSSPTGTWLSVRSSELGSTTVQLEANVYPANADNTALVWTSEDESVATVDANGLVTIIGYPDMMEVGITATAADGSNRKGTVNLRIVNPENDWGSVLCEGMDADHKTITIMKSQQTPATITVQLTPANSTANIDFDVVDNSLIQVEADYDNATGRRTGVFRISAPDPMMMPEIRTGSTQIHFYTHYYDEATLGTEYPEVWVNVNVIEDIKFTEETVQKVPVTYAVTSFDGGTCTVYGEWVDGHDENGTWVDGGYNTAIDQSTTGLVTVPNKARNYYVTGVDGSAFADCSRLEEVEFESGIKFIGNSAFTGCSNLREVLLPETIEAFGYSSFSNLPNLKDVHILATTPPTGGGIYVGNPWSWPAIGDSYAFSGLTGATLHVPAGCSEAYNISPWNVWFSRITEDAADGIEAVDGNYGNNGSYGNNEGWFDLSGRRVAHPTKGIYIFNGRKVVK